MPLRRNCSAVARKQPERPGLPRVILFATRLHVRIACALIPAIMPSTSSLSRLPDAEASTLAAQIRSVGARATPARISVLQILRNAPAALTHHDIERALGVAVLDRVTLYRVLDWLVDAGLAHKSTDVRGVFRFSVAAAGEHQAHTHFRCDFCGRVFCLDAPPPTPPRLPAGFSLSRIDLDLRGCCAHCAVQTA